MKIIYNDTKDAKIASVVLYQKFVLNFGLDMKNDDFQIINNAKGLSELNFSDGEYVCIVGIPATHGLYQSISILLKNKRCKIMYISTTGETPIIEKLYQLSKAMDDDGLSLKIIYDNTHSLSIMTWIASRYKINENISDILYHKPYHMTDKYEYLVFDGEETNHISIPWLIRFITDYVCNNQHQIQETNDFYFAIDTMLDMPSNHIQWERLLTDDKEVMQLMTSGIPIRQYVDRINMKSLKHAWSIPNGVVINDKQINFKTFITAFPNEKFYVKLFCDNDGYHYHIYSDDIHSDFMMALIKKYFDTDDNYSNIEPINKNVIIIHMKHNVFQSNIIKLNPIQRFIKKVFKIK